MKHTVRLLVLGFGWLLSSQAWAVSCDSIVRMVKGNVPVDIIILPSDRFSDADIQCLTDNNVPLEVIERAKKQMLGEVDPSSDSADENGISDNPVGTSETNQPVLGSGEVLTKRDLVGVILKFGGNDEQIGIRCAKMNPDWETAIDQDELELLGLPCDQIQFIVMKKTGKSYTVVREISRKIDFEGFLETGSELLKRGGIRETRGLRFFASTEALIWAYPHPDDYAVITAIKVFFLPITIPLFPVMVVSDIASFPFRGIQKIHRNGKHRKWRRLMTMESIMGRYASGRLPVFRISGLAIANSQSPEYAKQRMIKALLKDTF